MKGSIRVTVSNARLRYEFTINRNITSLIDRGATGKSTLHRLISEGDNSNGIHIWTSTGAKLVALTPSTWEALLAYNKGSPTIFVVDEFDSFINSNEFSIAFKESGCYLIIINRDIPGSLPVSIHEIYELETKNNITRFKRKYPDVIYGYKSFTHIIPEDSNSGKEFLELAFPGMVDNSDIWGKDAIIRKLRQSEEYPLVVADGAALGSLIKPILNLLKLRHGTLVAPESFEYVILKSKIMSLPDKELADLEENIEASEFLSWEAFFTSELIKRTAGTQLSYSKSKLAPAYKKETNISYILNAYRLERGTDSHTSLFNN